MSDSSDTILIVDDESSIRRLLRRALEQEGFRVLEAENGSELTSTIQNESVDLITLDLSLGSENGLELAREIKKESDVGIIIVSGKGELIDTVVGLEVGADDYITKPFELRDVIARVRAVLRRSAKHKATSALSDTSTTALECKFSFAGWTLDTLTRELRDQQEQICDLTTGEYELLHLLVRHPRQVLSRDQIMDQIKGHQWAANDRTIDNQVARLRKKLKVDDDQSAVIKTIRGAGYMFTPNVATAK